MAAGLCSVSWIVSGSFLPIISAVRGHLTVMPHTYHVDQLIDLS